MVLDGPDPWYPNASARTACSTQSWNAWCSVAGVGEAICTSTSSENFTEGW